MMRPNFKGWVSPNNHQKSMKIRVFFCPRLPLKQKMAPTWSHFGQASLTIRAAGAQGFAGLLGDLLHQWNLATAAVTPGVGRCQGRTYILWMCVSTCIDVCMYIYYTDISVYTDMRTVYNVSVYVRMSKTMFRQTLVLQRPYFRASRGPHPLHKHRARKGTRIVTISAWSLSPMLWIASEIVI